MEFSSVALLVVAGAFALVNGANDGGTLVATGLKIPTVRPLAAVLVLCASVGIVPWLVGTRVATTLATRLVTFEGAGGRTALLAAIVAAVAVVTLLASRGLPTSLTLAVVGGITGGGLGWGLPLSWGTVGTVLLLAALAPLAGGTIALGLARLVRRLPGGARAGLLLGRAHRGAYLVQCVAYSAGDGQKMLAVFAVAAGATGAVRPEPGHLVASALLFGVGLLAGLGRFARTLTGGVLSLRPAHAVGAELSASAAVLGSAAVGVPVSMTQTVAAALVGAGMSETYRKIRWETAARIVVAWLLTLPASFVTAAALAWTLKAVT